MGAVSGYNYEAFSFSLDPEGIGLWLADGPKPGEEAPPFHLPTVDGRVVGLSDCAGRPVVLEFGSYTCPIFCGHIEPMEQVARRHPEAAFLVIYTREAHPGELIPAHQNHEDKKASAKRLLEEERIGRIVLIDDLDGTVHRMYGPAWDSVYLLDGNHFVVLRQAWTHPDEVEAVLAQLALGTPVPPRETTEMAPPTGGPIGQGLLRGGKQALLDFYVTAPAPIQELLRQSPSPDVRRVLAELGE
jgi:hypothetical protein